MIIHALKELLIKKYDNYKVYIHNLAKFDIIFLLKYLVKLGSVNPIIHNERIISINFEFGGKYQLQFRDSYLILLASLKNLAKSFMVQIQKSIFPYLFVNDSNLNYVGSVPDFKYFIKVSKEEYMEYCKQFSNN